MIGRQYPSSVIPSLHLSPTVLLVEDSDDDAFFFARLLKKCGRPSHFVHLSNGRAALEYLGKCRSIPNTSGSLLRPDLIFLDLKLPAVSGFEILQWLSAHPFEMSLDVAVLSGSDQGTDRDQAAALGASDYLVKPLRLEQLRCRFDAWYRQHGPIAPKSAELV